MVRSIVSSPRHAKVIGHIDISIFANSSTSIQTFKVYRIQLPWRSAEHTIDNRAPLARSPLIETSFVHIVSTSSLTPNELIDFSLKVHVAYGTLSVCGFSSPIFVARRSSFGWQRRGLCKYFLKLSRKECQLVLKMFWCLQDCMESIYLVLAFVAFAVIRTCTRTLQPDRDGIDIAGRSHDIHLFFGTSLCSGLSPRQYDHPVHSERGSLPQSVGFFSPLRLCSV